MKWRDKRITNLYLQSNNSADHASHQIVIGEFYFSEIFLWEKFFSKNLISYFQVYIFEFDVFKIVSPLITELPRATHTK